MNNNDFPSSWQSAVLSDVATLIRGVTYKKNDASNVPVNGLLPILRANNIQAGKLVFDKLVYVPSNKISDNQKVKSGDIVIAMSSGSKNLVGKSANALENWNGGFGAFCGILRPTEAISKSYVSWFTYSGEYKNRVSELSAGVNINNLKPSHFDEIRIPVAPLAEQKQISIKLNELLEQVDTIKTRLDAIPNIIKQFRHSVLSAAVSGKLTEEWRKKGDLVLKRVDDFSKLVTKGASPKWQGINYVDDPSQTLFVTSENVGAMKLLLSKLKYVEDGFNLKQKRSVLQKGDVLTNIVGASIGRAAIWDRNTKANINQAVCIIRLDLTLCLPEYFNYYLNSPIGIDALLGNKVDVARANVSLSSVKNLKVLLPEIEEQTEIVQQVEKFFTFADQIEQRVIDAQSRINNLSKSILAKAFRGELTAEWREQNKDLIGGENSAEALLDKIKAERESIQITKPKKKKKKNSTKKKCE